jgi:hypothetical protein
LMFGPAVRASSSATRRVSIEICFMSCVLTKLSHCWIEPSPPMTEIFLRPRKSQAGILPMIARLLVAQTGHRASVRAQLDELG